jgi:hypothetical protein
VAEGRRQGNEAARGALPGAAEPAREVSAGPTRVSEKAPQAILPMD